MQLGYLALQGQDINTRIDVDSRAELGGGLFSFDDYSGKAKTFRGKIIVPSSRILSITVEANKEATAAQ